MILQTGLEVWQIAKEWWIGSSVTIISAQVLKKFSSVYDISLIVADQIIDDSSFFLQQIKD